MRTFFYKVLLFTLIPILILYPIDIFLSYHLKKTSVFSGEYEVWNDIYNGKIDAEIEIIGSSRAFVHIDPEIMLDNLGLTSYNFGVDGHKFLSQNYRHTKFIKHNKKPKYILVSLDLLTLTNSKELFNMEQFLPYLLWNFELSRVYNENQAYSSFDYILPLVRYLKFSNSFTKKKVYSKILNPSNKLRKNGYKGQDYKWNQDFSKLKAKQNEFNVMLDTSMLNLFQQFIVTAKKEKIPLIFVYTPEYIEGQQFVKNRAEVINLYEELALKNNIYFLDYSKNEICYQQDKFYNTMHLNKTGAEIFTKMLSEDLRKIGVYKKE